MADAKGIKEGQNMDVTTKRFINEKVKPAIHKRIPQMEKDLEYLVNAVLIMSESIPALIDRVAEVDKRIAALEAKSVPMPKKRTVKPKPALKVVDGQDE